MLLEQTNTVIGEVERLSGRKVLVQEDPLIPTLATVRIARGSIPFHLVRYREISNTVNYLIVYQLGFLLRMFSCPEGERWEVSASAEEKERGSQRFSLSTLPPTLAPPMFDNLVTQLRTYSVGQRIDEWILQQFPELWEEQKNSVQTQLSQNEQALAPEIREQFPRKLVDINSAMNAAYANYWANRFREPRYIIPFTSLGYQGIGDRLCAVLDDIPDMPETDRKLTERWAQILEMTDCFHFVSHSFND